MASDLPEISCQSEHPNIKDYGGCKFKDAEQWTETESQSLNSSLNTWVARDSWHNDQHLPEHTPNKQPKIDLTNTVNTSLHEITATGYVLDSNIENFSVDLESYCKTSQFPDSGIESSSSVSSWKINSASTSQTPNSSYSTVKNTSTSDSQWQGSSVCTLLSDGYKSTYSSLFSQTGGSKGSGIIISREPLAQDLCSTSQCNSSQQLALSSANTSWHAKHRNGHNPGNQPDTLFDQGYSSHSAGSSNQGQDSQREESVMEQGSQLDFGTDGWSAGNKLDDNYLHGENELEDLLYHFQNFFHDRFENEFRRYQESVYGIIQEQQNHVRQIVHTAIREQSASQRNYTEELLSQDTDKIIAISKSTNQTGMPITSMLDTDYYIPVSMSVASPPKSPAVMKDEVVKRRLLDLYSLSCSVSTLLAKTQFKSWHTTVVLSQELSYTV